MGKKDNIRELIILLALSLSHRIGSIINKNEIYAEKYAKESENFLNKAKKVVLRENWSAQDKIIIKEELRKKLRDELTKRDFLDNKKFDIMDEEIYKVLKSLDLI